MCTNKDFAHVKTSYLAWNPNELACCGNQKEVPVAPSGSLTQMTELRYLSADVSVSGGGAFPPIFQTKLKFDKIYIFSLKLTELCINKDFAHIKTPYLAWNPNEIACCGSPKEVPAAPLGSLTQMTVKILVTRCPIFRNHYFCHRFILYGPKV